MPSIRGISVHVTDSQDVRLEEWGVQHLRTRTKQDKVSAYIKATTGVSFRIMIEAELPYTDYSSEDTGTARIEGLEDYGVIDVHGRRAQGYRRPFPRIGRGSHRSQDLSSSQYRASGFDHGYWPPVTPHPPPFDLLATLYIDGREKAERKVVIYLDPEYEDFHPGVGHQTSRSIIKSRWVQGRDGMIHEHAWVFKDIGIESILDKMALTSENDSMPADEEDAVIDALNRGGICHEDDIIREEKHKTGQIKVEITRIVLDKKRVDREFRPKHREGEDENLDMGKLKSEISHTAAFAPLRSMSPRDVPVISYEPYDDDDEPCAVFKFFYRSQETLEKFNFPGFVPLSKKPIRSSRVNAHLNHITPLGISRGHTSTSKSKRVQEKAFEDMIKEGGFKTDQPPQWNFDSRNNRRVSTNALGSSQMDHNASSDDSRRPAQLWDSKFGSEAQTDETDIRSSTESNAQVNERRRSLRSYKQPNHILRLRDPKANTEETLQARPNTDSDTARATNEWDDASIDSSSTLGGYQAPSVNNQSVIQAGNSLLPRNVEPLTITNDTLRDEISSDADDEHDGASDLETLAGVDDNESDDDDDDGQNMDKDDEGLHKDLKEHLKLGKRTRATDGSPEDEKTVIKHYDTEEEQSLAENNGTKKRLKKHVDWRKIRGTASES